jgi:hypothetical protein
VQILVFVYFYAEMDILGSKPEANKEKKYELGIPPSQPGHEDESQKVSRLVL